MLVCEGDEEELVIDLNWYFCSEVYLELDGIFVEVSGDFVCKYYLLVVLGCGVKYEWKFCVLLKCLFFGEVLVVGIYNFCRFSGWLRVDVDGMIFMVEFGLVILGGYILIVLFLDDVVKFMKIFGFLLFEKLGENRRCLNIIFVWMIVLEYVE